MKRSIFCLLLLLFSIAVRVIAYTGEKLTLNFQEIEVRAALQLIADFSGFNIVANDSVGGKVTLRLEAVPWDEALDIILKAKGLAKRKMGKILLIGPTEELALREKEALTFRQQVEALLPLHAEAIKMNYANAVDIAALLKKGKNSLLSKRGNVSVDERTNTLLVQETDQKLAEIRTLLARLDVPLQQVLIESRVVYANEGFEDQLGVHFHSTRKTKQKEKFNVHLPTGRPQLEFSIATLPGGTLLDLELMALESEGLGKIVASPRLVTSHQQRAYIESGEEIPYQETTLSGATSVAFKKAVLRLEVIPQITKNRHIVLDLKVNQDSRGQATVGIPSIHTRQMHTKVLIADGETIVLGGIYQQQKTAQKSRVPFLGRLPLVGHLFKTQANQRQRNELLIFVTPRIIQTPPL